jgi:hypothetical protein
LVSDDLDHPGGLALTGIHANDLSLLIRCIFDAAEDPALVAVPLQRIEAAVCPAEEQVGFIKLGPFAVGSRQQALAGHCFFNGYFFPPLLFPFAVTSMSFLFDVLFQNANDCDRLCAELSLPALDLKAGILERFVRAGSITVFALSMWGAR